MQYDLLTVPEAQQIAAKRWAACCCDTLRKAYTSCQDINFVLISLMIR